MSWFDKIQGEFIIQTGDGKRYSVLWKPAKRSAEYNLTEFDFPGLEGTLPKRKKARGIRYAVEFYFQGDNYLDEVAEFIESAKDERYWTILHPMYGTIKCQPAGLEFDDTQLNVTKVTGTVIETIIDDRPKVTEAPASRIVNTKLTVDDTFSETFTDIQFNLNDVAMLRTNTESVYLEANKKVKLTADAEALFNAYNTANTAILSVTSEPLATARAIQALINAPMLFVDSVQNRLDIMRATFDQIRLTLPNVADATKKKIFQLFGGGLVSGAGNTSATPQDGDYPNRNEVFAVTTTLLDMNNQYLEDLDALQTENGGSPDSFIPDAGSMMALGELMNYTIANLFDIALEAKQERSLILEYDSNVVTLTHRFYGLDSADANMDRFIKQNGFGYNDLLGIEKGRKIIYYV
jgi:hypothetical protein